MERRGFLKITAAGTLAMMNSGRAEEMALTDKPNILVIMTDQQFADCMSCVMGKTHINTPNMDALAANGVRFTRAYAANPLCVPMRTSMMTGLYPHQTTVQSNGDRAGFTTDNKSFLGKVFKQAGYSTAYFGKWHIPLSTKDADVHGFDVFMEKEARLDPNPSADFLKQKHDKPFFVFASFLSPHEVCEYARKQNLPGGPIDEPPPVEERPPLRTNSEPPANETDVMTYMRKSYHASSKFPVGNYSEDDWRRLAWGYYRLIERADRFVGVLLEALRESGKEKDTVVVFLSDHGDCHGAHGFNQKTVFYEESARVPFIISRKGTTKQGTSDLLVNLGVDLFPTLCDFAGIKPPANLPGLSMKAPALGMVPDRKHDYVVSQNHMVQGAPVDGVSLKPLGRMVRSEQYKYCIYSEGERRESLVDLKSDPGEMVNQAGNPHFEAVLQQHRAFLGEHASKHEDKGALEMLGNVGSAIGGSPSITEEKAVD